jgi:hypothetical protein
VLIKKWLKTDGSTAVHHPKVKGLSLASDVTGGDITAKKREFVLYFKYFYFK